MKPDKIQSLVKEEPRTRCLFCSNFGQLTEYPYQKRVGCKVGLTPPCGRQFSPKKGGDYVLA